MSTTSPSEIYHLPAEVDGFTLTEWGEYEATIGGRDYRIQDCISACVVIGWEVVVRDETRVGTSWEWKRVDNTTFYPTYDAAIEALRAELA